MWYQSCNDDEKLNRANDHYLDFRQFIDHWSFRMSNLIGYDGSQSSNWSTFKMGINFKFEDGILRNKPP